MTKGSPAKVQYARDVGLLYWENTLATMFVPMVGR